MMKTSVVKGRVGTWVEAKVVKCSEQSLSRRRKKTKMIKYADNEKSEKVRNS
jgi:hypothetical protein